MNAHAVRKGAAAGLEDVACDAGAKVAVPRGVARALCVGQPIAPTMRMRTQVSGPIAMPIYEVSRRETAMPRTLIMAPSVRSVLPVTETPVKSPRYG